MSKLRSEYIKEKQDVPKLPTSLTNKSEYFTDEYVKWLEAKLKDHGDIGSVSKRACPHCEGTGIMAQDYYEDDDVGKIVTLNELCIGCDGSGKEED